MPQPRAIRVARGSVAAGIATFVALLSHAAGGGQMPGWLGVVVPLVLSVAVCTALAGRRLSLWRLSLAVATSQVFFHTLFVLGTFAPSAATIASPSHHIHGPVPILMGEAAAASSHLHADASMWLSSSSLSISNVGRGSYCASAIHRVLEKIRAGV